MSRLERKLRMELIHFGSPARAAHWFKSFNVREKHIVMVYAYSYYMCDHTCIH